MALAVSLFAATPLRAQPTLPPGTRVRVLSRDSVVADGATGPRTEGVLRRRTGRLVMTTPAMLLLAPPGAGQVDTIPVASLVRLEVGRGRADRRGAGTIVGGLLGGGAFTGLACAFGNGSCGIGGHEGGFALYFATGAIPGALAGRAIGRRLRGAERWERVWP